MFSQNKIDDGPYGGGRASDADAVAERESLRGLLARPFCWLGFVAVVRGSQLVAAQQTGRRCYAIEKSPPFIAVALERMARSASSLNWLANEECDSTASL